MLVCIAAATGVWYCLRRIEVLGVNFPTALDVFPFQFTLNVDKDKLKVQKLLLVTQNNPV